MIKKLLSAIFILFCLANTLAAISIEKDNIENTLVCDAPTNLFVTNITSTSATFSWTGGGNTEFEVTYGPAGGGNPVTVNVTGNTYTATGLNPDTDYTIRVKAVCNNELSSSATSLFNTLPLTLSCGNTCTYTFESLDSFGDGWNGNMMLISQNGVVVSSIQQYNSDNGTTTKTVTLCDNTPFEVYWDGGNFPTEVGLTILNSFGQAIYSMPFGNSDPNVTIYTGNVDCTNQITCEVPTYISAHPNLQDLILNWQTGTATQWEIFMTPVGSPAPTAYSTGIITSSMPYIVTGMAPFTAYDFYIRTVCAGSNSNWSYRLTYMPACGQPSNLTVEAVTTTTATLTWTGNAPQYEVIILPSDQAPGDSTTGIAVTGNTYNATGLTTNQPYKFYVRGICGANIMSAWKDSAEFTPFVALAPLTVSTTTYTVPQLVNTVLINNPCVSATNITYSTGNLSSSNGIGYFVNTNPTFPIASGIVLSTGNALQAPGPNTTTLSAGDDLWPGDTQLDAIIEASGSVDPQSKNATRLEFDFTTLTENMSFNFLFASEEYGTYQCVFSDAFAFLLTDLVSGVTTNIAVVPNTTVPISVTTIRDNAYNGACPSVNPDYFDTFFSGPLANSSATNFNGQTTELTASATVIPNHPYHIKMVIADRMDAAFDSAVFIEAGSFSVGPPQCNDKIKMMAFVDANGNNIKDTGEVSFNYGSFTYEQNNDGTIHNIISPSGEYTIYDSNAANTYDLGYAINAEFAPYFSASATSVNNISIPSGSGTQTFYFPIVVTQPFNDVSAALIPVIPPRPGNYDFTEKIAYTNFGMSATSGTITFTKDPALGNFVDISQTVTETATGFTYNFTYLLPYETRFITVRMFVPGLAIGDLVTNSVTISAPSGDINLNNNSGTATEAVVNSYDPNNIVESHGEKIQFDQFSPNDYLYYTINFQNIGTANAIDVRIEDLLDARLDETSIRMVSSSHNYVMERVGSQLTWRFEDIQLPGEIVNEELSKGYVTFMVKVKSGFTVGTIIPNMASIYFDSNEPIATNTFYTEFVQQLATPHFDVTDVAVYPNPTSGIVNVNLTNSSGNIESIALYDMVGKMVKQIGGISTTETTIDVSALSKGIYLMEVITDKQLRLTKKLIIQ